MSFDYITADLRTFACWEIGKASSGRQRFGTKVIVDRSKELKIWVDVCQQTLRRGIPTYVYVNNHYAGHAPATAAEFLKIWNASK
jgi:hypothetical protein